MENISYYVKGLFRGVEETKEIEDQRLELECHIKDRMSDLMNSGMSKDNAFQKTVKGLGNLDELIDTITGKKVRVPVVKISFIDMLLGTIYGICYLFTIYLYLRKNGDWKSALLIVCAGLSGYLIPFCYFLINFIKYRNKIEAVSVKKMSDILSCIIGWIIISIVCWIVNYCLIKMNCEDYHWWAWMPTAGVFTWPVMSISFDLLVKWYGKQNTLN